MDSTGDARADLKTVNLLNGAVTVLRADSDEVPNGMVLENEGNLLVWQQGSKSREGFIQKIDLMTLAKLRVWVAGHFDVTKSHSITVFDVGADGLLCNRRCFASVGVCDGSSRGLGIPGGVKVDTEGRVYTGTVDGVQVFSHSGIPLGRIRQPGVVNTGFAGKGLNMLYVLNDSGCGIAYEKFRSVNVHACQRRWAQVRKLV